ncbi:rod shape-determining protein MreD [Eubacteriales bacterium OttesenSCG-928-N14]|nr:rod shape-determining protein MreD [Eubacteriales bacterium OttesenSCG-928-N14]
MKVVTLGAVLMLALGIDGQLARISLLGIRPLLVLCVVVSMGIINGKFTGAMAGLFIGLVMDMLFGPKLGFYGLCMMLTGYLITDIYRRGHGDNNISSGMFSFFAYLLYNVFTLVGALALGVNVGNVLMVFLRYILPSALLTGVCAIGIHFLIRLLFMPHYMQRKWLLSDE